MGSAKTGKKEAEAHPRLDGLRELLGILKGRKPSRLLRLRLMISYVVLAKTGTLGERVERYAVAGAVARANDRLFAEYGVRLRCTPGALLRLAEMSNPPDRPRVSPDAVVGRRVRAPARRLIRFHKKAGRGGVLQVEERPGGRVRVVVARRGSLE